MTRLRGDPERFAPSGHARFQGTWQKTESNRDAKYCAITRPGERELVRQAERWRRLAGLVEKLLLEQ